MKTPAAVPASKRSPLKRPRTGGRSTRVVMSVLDATVAELARCGFDALSIGDVAAAAGVHPTSVYRRWPGKLELVMAACLRSAAAAIDDHDRGSLAADLERLLLQVDRFLHRPEGLAMVALTVSAATLPERREPVRRYWRERLAALSAIHQRAVARGDWPAGKAPDALIEMLLGPLYVRRFVTQRRCTKAFVAELVGRTLGTG